MAVNNLLKL